GEMGQGPAVTGTRGLVAEDHPPAPHHGADKGSDGGDAAVAWARHGAGPGASTDRSWRPPTRDEREPARGRPGFAPRTPTTAGGEGGSEAWHLPSSMSPGRRGETAEAAGRVHCESARLR